jgi:hypothetical protein
MRDATVVARAVPPRRTEPHAVRIGTARGPHSGGDRGGVADQYGLAS